MHSYRVRGTAGIRLGEGLGVVGGEGEGKVRPREVGDLVDRTAGDAGAWGRGDLDGNPETRIEVETLKTIAMFCGVGLFVLLLLATYGLDLSAGFF